MLQQTVQLRWAVDVSAWHPAPGEVEWLAGLLPSEEASAALAYKREADRKRALVGRLLARRACSEALALPWGAVEIRRTRGGKPYAANNRRAASSGIAAATPPAAAAAAAAAGLSQPSEQGTEAAGGVLPGARTEARALGQEACSCCTPNFNFNVAHEGDFVVLAADGLCLVGADISAPRELRRGPAAAAQPLLEALQLVRKQLAQAEWERIAALTITAGDAAAEAAFQRAWACKEAYTKACGTGIGFGGLDRICLAADPFAAVSCCAADPPAGGPSWLAAGVELDGAPLPRWRVELHALPRSHWAAVALGPPEAAVDALGGFTATLQQPHLTNADLALLLARPPPPFRSLTILELLPAGQAADEYRTRFVGG